jgi:hypothetical protein
MLGAQTKAPQDRNLAGLFIDANAKRYPLTATSYSY